MIINQIYKNLSEDLKECFVSGLVFGLVTGLVFGLVTGLVTSLIFGLVTGLVTSLIFGLIFGLVWVLVNSLVFCLVWVLVFGLVFGFVNLSLLFPSSWIIYILLGILLLGEILYWLDKGKKPKKENKLLFVAKKKFENLLEAGIIIVWIGIINYFINNIYFPDFFRIGGYIGLGFICLLGISGIIYLWLKLNSLKYKEKK